MGQTIDAMVDGGKASAAPPLGPALGPAGVPIPKVIAAINEKTKDFAGMQVPVKITVHDDKTFDITVGTPPTSAMIKKEVKLETLSGKPNKEKLADMKLQQIIKIAKNKLDSFNTSDAKSAVKQVIGTCASSGILVEGIDAKLFMQEVISGKHDEMIYAWKTDITAEELKKLDEERKVLAKKAEDLHKKQRETAEKIVAEMKDVARFKIVQALEEAEVPQDLIHELLPAKKAGEEGAPAAAAAPAKK